MEPFNGYYDFWEKDCSVPGSNSNEAATLHSLELQNLSLTNWFNFVTFAILGCSEIICFTWEDIKTKVKFL